MSLIQRRSFLTGFASLFAAPAIVRAASLMPVRTVLIMPMAPQFPPGFVELIRYAAELYGLTGISAEMLGRDPATALRLGSASAANGGASIVPGEDHRVGVIGG